MKKKDLLELLSHLKDEDDVFVRDHDGDTTFEIEDVGVWESYHVIYVKLEGE